MSGEGARLSSILALVKQAIGTSGITTASQCDRILRHLFGDRYIGVVEWKSSADIPKLVNGQLALLNKDVHWTAVYKKHNKLYEIDSFNRDLLGARYIDDKVPRSFKQTPYTSDCGQRTIAKLIADLL